jgi:hypothetical protein
VKKINAANRKHDQLSKAISRSENDTNNRDQLLQRLLAYETEICELETRLDELLDAKTDRRQKLLTDRTTHRHREQPIVQNKEAKETTVTQDASPLSLSSPSSSNNDNNPAIRTTFNAAAALCGARDESSLLCNECGIIPTQRQCRKCKDRYVCDVCCSTKRGLELIWWCDICFGKETTASQNLIRSGDYDSEAEDGCRVDSRSC